jgi:hypothetical protein
LAKLGPDASPRFLAKHLSREQAVTLSLYSTGLCRIHVPAPGDALVQVLLMYADLLGNLSALFGGKLCAHSQHLSDSLDALQATRSIPSAKT